ncbi:MAG TPA: pyridoxal phosphate-dependent aminotransferase [Candidatus Dormibacteraeota bacterium]|nr:pyridoxal phosphate-dependent aminotransferase [Candidatus Dormibacteraeota bacterium]
MAGISRRVAAITESATLAVDNQARALRAAGHSIISFGAGEPDFPTPPHIVEAAGRACEDPKAHHYTPATGLPELRAAVAERRRLDTGQELSPEQVLITVGTKQAVAWAFATLLDPGDEVLIPAPYWVTFPEAVTLAGGRPVPVLGDATDGFRITVDRLQAATTPATKALLLNSPTNPTGLVYRRDELEAIGRWALEAGIWVVADEIYQDLTYGDHRFHSLAAVVPELADRILTLGGVAKSYAMTGWRIGWLFGAEPVVRAAGNLHSHLSGNASNVAQFAALAALQGPREPLEAMRAAFDRRRREIHRRLDAMPGVTCREPEGAFYVFASFEAVLAAGAGGPGPRTTQELAAALLDEVGVAIVPGEAFGVPGYARLSYALSDEALTEGLDRLATFLG